MSYTEALPMPNHCVECDKPTFNTMCNECKEKEEETNEEPMSDCCTAPFTEPGWPDSDFCSKCYEHAGIWEDEDEGND